MYAVNCSILFTDTPLLERPAAAARAGFDAVEFWWPWPVAVPGDAEVDRFVAAVAEAGVQLVGLNFAAGDMPGGDRGLVSWPARSGEFRDNVDVTVGIGERLGCRAFNALYGNRVDGVPAAEQDELAAENLAIAARAAKRADGTVLVEPVSGAPRYPLRTAADALAAIDRASTHGAVDNIRLLLDVYHLAVNGDDVDAAIDAAAGRIGHVQIADAPGRHQPGTGELPIARWTERILATGYDGRVALEYVPEGPSSDSFGWLEGTAMTTVAFIGLGIMGAPMAANLVKAGFDVVGYNRSPEKVEELVGQGGRGAEDVASAVREADVVITMLPDSPDVEGVTGGPDGVFAHAREGALHVDMSTIRPDVAVRVAEAGRAAGVRVLDAPVSGGEAGAVEGTLSIMVGGSADDFAAARPVLDAVGKTVVHVGPAGSGQTVKAANQLIVAGNIQLLAEAIVFLEAHDADLGAALEVLGGGLAGSTVMARKGAGMLAREFAPGFRLALHHKDMGIVTSAAREAGVTIPLGAAVAQLVAAMVARGDGGLDHSGLLKLVADLSGRQ